MDIKEIKEKKKSLISISNPEWQHILNLRLEVQRDFHDNEALSIPTFDKILGWTLHKQTARIEKIKNFNPHSLIESITNCYCKINHPDKEMNTRIKMHVLLSIPWIGIGISSAIMALHEPRHYGNIDLRSWSVLFNEKKKTFSIKDFNRFLKKIREIANTIGCDAQEIDYILWKQYEAKP